MNRRSALKQLGFGMSAGLLLPGMLSSCANNDPGPEVNYDGVVAIIGAGAAGLFAADILRTKGVKVRVFEAHERVGGRIYSIRSLNNTEFNAFPRQDFPIEIGAERVLGSNGAWAEVIELLRVPSFKFKDQSFQKYIIDSTLRSEAEAALDSEFLDTQNFFNNLTNIAGNSVQSAASAQGITSRMQAILNSQVGNAYGTNNASLSADALAEALTKRERNNEELIIRNNPMQDILISRFSETVNLVELNSKVTRIDNQGATIDLTVQNTIDQSQEVVTVNKVIVAVPISVLKSGDLQFSPPLPATKTEAMSKIGMDASLRIVLDFRQNLWGNDTSFILGGNDGPLYFNAGVGRSEFNKILSVTINGPKAAELGAMGNGAINEVVLELDSILDKKASSTVKNSFIIKDWAADQFIKGGYSYPLPGGSESDRVALAEAINDNLFFAGEATDLMGDWGTVNGALNSGERVALEVIETIVNPVV